MASEAKLEAEALFALRAWVNCPIEKRPSARALGERIARLATIAARDDEIASLRAEAERLRGELDETTKALTYERDAANAAYVALNNSSYEIGKQLTAERDEARADRDRMAEALRENFCPRPANTRPDGFTVGQCVDAGECGCMNLAVLNAEKRDGGAG